MRKLYRLSHLLPNTSGQDLAPGFITKGCCGIFVPVTPPLLIRTNLFRSLYQHCLKKGRLIYIKTNVSSSFFILRRHLRGGRLRQIRLTCAVKFFQENDDHKRRYEAAHRKYAVKLRVRPGAVEGSYKSSQVIPCCGCCKPSSHQQATPSMGCHF